LVAVVLALFSFGCAGQVLGPEEFAFTTESGSLYIRGQEAADIVNAENPDVLITVELASPGEAALINLAPYPTGPGYDQEWIGISSEPRTHVLTIGEEASIGQIADGMRDWIAMFTTRD
jgi:hypothetical protein